MPDGLADIKDLLDNSPRTRVHRIAEEEGIDPSLADDFLKVTGGIESGNRHYAKKGKVLRSPAGAWGFGQVMPDQKGGTTRTINGRKFNLLDEDDNIRAGLTYFSQGGSDPVARRLGYLSGHHSRAVKSYKSTGRIPKGGDPYTGVSFSQYVQASGEKAKPRNQLADISDLAEEQADISDLLDQSQDAAPPPPSKPKPKRSLGQMVSGGVGGIAPAQSNLPNLSQLMTEAREARRGPRPYAPRSPFAGVKAGAGEVVQPTGVGGLRQLDEPEVARITRIQKQVAAETRQSGLERGGGSEAQGLAQRYRQLPTTQHAEVLRRVSEERENESRRAELLEQLTPEDRATIREMTERWAGLDPVSRGIETGSQRVGSGLLYKIAGLTDVLGGRENNVLGNYLRVQAGRGELTIEEIQNEIPPEAAEQAAEFITQAIGTLPEIYAASAALGPVGGFAALGGVEALGRGEEAPAIASETAKGAILGKVFKGAGAAEVPIRPGMNRLGQRLANIARSSVPIAAGTAGTEVAFGADPREAAVSAASNVLFHVGARLPKELPAVRENVANRLVSRQLAGQGHEVISQPGERPKIRLRTQGIERPVEQPIGAEEGTPPDVLNEIVSDVRARLAQPSTRQRKARQPGKDRPAAQPAETRPISPEAGVASTAPVAATTPQPSRIVQEGKKFTVVTPTRSGEMRTTVGSRAVAEGIAERADAANQQPVPAAKIPFLITRDMRSRLEALGYADSVINKMKPARAHEILEVERPAHPSDVQNRRQRNVKTGAKGQFKKGKIEEPETVRVEPESSPPLSANARASESQAIQLVNTLKWNMGKAKELSAADAQTVIDRSIDFNKWASTRVEARRQGFPPEETSRVAIDFLSGKIPSIPAKGSSSDPYKPETTSVEQGGEAPTAINIITGKKVKPKKGEGGFINVVEVNRALDELGGRTREFRRRLMSKRPELFKYASTDEKARWLAGMITGPANPPSEFEPSAEYLRTMDAVRSDFPSWSDAKIHDWIKANRPDLQFGGAVQDLTGAVPKPLSPAERFAREQVSEFEGREFKPEPEYTQAEWKERQLRGEQEKRGVIDLLDRDIDAGPRGKIKKFLADEKGEWDIERSKELVQRAGKELHRAYNALASHQARRRGFSIVNDDVAKNYFTQLYRFAERHNPNLIEDVAKAERAYSEGRFDAAHLHSEKALSGTHDFANQLNLAAGGLHLAEKGIYLNSYNTNWIDTLKEVRRRLGEVGGEAAKSFLKDETGSLDLRRYPKGGRPNTTKLAWIFEPAVEKLWISANQRVQQGKLKAKDLREYVKNEFASLLDKEFSDMHLVNRRAVLTLGAKRLSQIAGPVVAEKATPEMSYESRRADWQKNVSLWKSYNDMPTEQLIALAQQKFPESYRTNPEAAVDRLFHQIMPKVKKKTAETWHEEVMNRLNAQETALDKEAAKMATELPSHAEQANILAGREVVPPKAPPPADEPELTGGKKVRRYWETLEKTGREAGTEAGYDPEKMADWKRDAEKLISDFGIEGAERFYENAKPSGVRTAVGQALGDYYQIEAARTGNKELLAKSVELANERVTGMTEQGRAIKAADLANKFTLSGALDEATKLWRQASNKPSASLPDDIAAEVNAKAVARDKAQKKVDKLKATVESEPELPRAEVRKPKIIKGGGKPKITDDPGQAGYVALGGPKLAPEVVAARERKKEAAKTFRVMEKRVGKYWTKASHPELEAARIELNQATYDLALMFKALEQRNQGYFRHTWNLTRSLMVSAWPTAARNAQTQVARSGVERLTDAAELLIRKAVGLDSDLVMKDVWKNYVRQFDPSAKRFSEQILRAHPDELLRIYATYSGGVDIPIPNKMARGVEKLFGKAEAFSYHMNVFNRIQEFHVRSAEFLAELEIHTKKETGMKLEEFVARYGADKLPQPLIKRAVDKALEVTFAANPPRDTNMGRNLNLLIELGNKLPPTMSPAAFPRFMYNNLKFLYQYNPLGGLANIAYQTKRGGNVPRAIAQQLIGTSMTLLAYQIRNDPELAGGKWYELKTPLGTFDTRPFGPFSTYLLFAEAARRYMKGERGLTGKEWVEGLGASTAPGGLSIATVERLWNYWEQGDWDKAMFMAKTELGDIGRAVFTPVRQLKDIIAQFDPEERKTRDTRNAPVVGPIAESIPYASRAMGLPEARRQTTARPIQQEAPLLKFLTGYRKVADKTFIESELDRLHFRPQEIRRWTGVRELDAEVTRNMGAYLDAESEKLQNDPQYQQASDAKKFVIMRKVLAGARKASLGQAARQQPEAFKQYKSREPYWKKQLKQDSAP